MRIEECTGSVVRGITGSRLREGEVYRLLVSGRTGYTADENVGKLFLYGRRQRIYGPDDQQVTRLSDGAVFVVNPNSRWEHVPGKFCIEKE